MTPERWSQIDTLFPQVVDLKDAERSAFLDAKCRDDAELRRELESLIECAADAAPTLRAVIEHEAETMAGAAVATQLGRRVGSYRLLEPLGEGGMGVVYRAVRDDNEYVREVAIKILRFGLDSPHAIARFRDERQILARLDHPNIVRLLDGGTTDDNLPYLVMEHLKGVSITHHARDRELSVRERVQLIVTICDAVHYAHQLLIVHRDLKPSNILVGADGVPKLLDFGIAKLLDTGARREAQTIAGAALMTVDYASPEQLRGESTSTATDIYSLGAVLYELLTDCPPHAGQLEVVRRLGELDVARPSSVAPPARRAQLAGDVDKILAKALCREPAGRYGTMELLADDLRRHLDGRPVLAQAPTLRYRAGKWLRRNRGVASIAAGAVVIVGVALALVWHHAAQADALAMACKGGSDKLAGAWDPATRARVEAAFLATKRSHAADTFARVAAALDERSAAWVTMRTEACEATSLRHEQSSTLLDLRMQCLDHRLSEARSLTELFVHADGPLVDNAVSAVYKLGELEPCADTHGLLAATPPPDNLVTREKVAALRDRLTHGEALDIAGRYRESEGVLTTLVAEARTLDYPPVLGEALLLLAMPQMNLYEDGKAQVVLEEALLVLAGVSDDKRVATIWIRLINVLGVGQSRPADALVLRIAAEAALVRAGGDRRQRALLDHNLGSVLKIQGKYDEALVLQQQALAIQRELLDPNDPIIGNTRNSIGVVLMHQGRSQQALAEYTETLAFFKRVYGPEHPSVAGILINMGNLEIHDGRDREAVSTLEQALAIQEKTVGPDHPDVAETLGSLGTARLRHGDLAGARRDFERGLAVCEQRLPADHLVLASALRRAGALWVMFGEAEKGRAAIARALAIYESKLGPDNPAIGEALAALATAQTALGKLDEADATYRRALGIQMQDHDGVTEAASESELDIALMKLEDPGKLADALAVADHALATREQIFGSEHPHLGTALGVKGEVLVALGRTTEAIPLLERAVEILEPAGPPIHLARARFALARALSSRPSRDLARVHALTTAARDGLTAAGPPGARDLAHLVAWLKANPASE